MVPMLSRISVSKRSCQRLSSSSDRTAPAEMPCGSGEGPELDFRRIEVIEFGLKEAHHGSFKAIWADTSYADHNGLDNEKVGGKRAIGRWLGMVHLLP